MIDIEALWLAIESYFSNMTTAQVIWKLVGLSGLGLFSIRWLVQWIASERKAKSHVPLAFWYLSFAGSLMTLSYALHIQDEIFILGNIMNALVYFRNLMLIKKSQRQLTSG